jgi:addiction module RelE/StbE family toxin
MRKPIKILWDNQAKNDLKLLFDFLKIKSPEIASKLIQNIVNQTKTIHFTEQYQVDEFLGEPYRRMIVSHFKIVYKVHNKFEIRILQVFDTRQNPNQLNK